MQKGASIVDVPFATRTRLEFGAGQFPSIATITHGTGRRINALAVSVRVAPTGITGGRPFNTLAGSALGILTASEAAQRNISPAAVAHECFGVHCDDFNLRFRVLHSEHPFPHRKYISTDIYYHLSHVSSINHQNLFGSFRYRDSCLADLVPIVVPFTFHSNEPAL